MAIVLPLNSLDADHVFIGKNDGADDRHCSVVRELPGLCRLQRDVSGQLRAHHPGTGDQYARVFRRSCAGFIKHVFTSP
jgi:hypothetical protein